MVDALERLTAALADRYTIERELGAGGMATVYLARDLRHDRAVAIKVLRPELAAALGPERFLREIKTTAQLVHPHILPLLDSGEAGGTLFYVMPYVEGESLRDRLTRERQLPLEDALQIAREVADALSYAHSHGIIHRDIKPENVLFEGGHAVASDFGIARAVSAAGGAKLTETGLAIGTPAYMSPEQAAGSHDVDGRSDLYSLGCMLYEMLSGETPYTAPTPQALLAKKLSEPLPRVSVVREAVPPGLEVALNKALARTPADRFVTAAEFAAALSHPETMGGITLPGRGRRRRRARLFAAVAGSLIAAGAAAALAWRAYAPRPLEVTAPDIIQVTNEPGVEYQPAISPDGTEIAYVSGPIGAPHLVIRGTENATGGGQARLDESWPGGEWFPAWSPDGSLVRFMGCRAVEFKDCRWYETGRLGGTAKAATVPAGANSPVWSPDGSRVAYVSGDTLLTATPDGADAHAVVWGDSARWPDRYSLSWSPDAKRIAYVRGNPLWLYSHNLSNSDIRIVSATGGRPHVIAGPWGDNNSPVWLDDRHLLYVSDLDGADLVYNVAVGRRGARGAPRVITGITDAHSISYAAAARTLAFAKLTYRQNIWAYPLGRPSPLSIRHGQPVTTGTAVVETQDVSPDGKWVAYSSPLRGTTDVYNMPVAGGQPVRLAQGEAPRWSPDGREVALNYVTTDSGAWVVVVPAEGGTPVRVAHHCAFPSWAPDGLALLFICGNGRDWLATRDSVGGAWHAPIMFADLPTNFWDGEWAPDSSGVLKTYGSRSVLQVRTRHGRIVWGRDISAAYGLTLAPHEQVLHYSRDGRTIYAVATHRDGRYGIWAIPVAGGPTHLVVAFDDPRITWAHVFSVGPDGLYLTVTEYESDIWVARLKW